MTELCYDCQNCMAISDDGETITCNLYGIDEVRESCDEYLRLRRKDDLRFVMGESDIIGERCFKDFKTGELYWDEYFDEVMDLCNELDKELKQKDSAIKILKEEIDTAQKICTMLSERLRGYNE